MQLGHRDDIQQLRGLAVLAVVLYHSGGLLPSGFVGVDMFFVISGYVVMASVLPRLQQRDFSIWAFLARRIRRILPALGVMLAVVLVASSLLSSVASRVQTVRTGIFASLMSANVFLYTFRPDGYFVVTEKSNALLHTWSLSLEEEFYIVFAVIVGLAAVIPSRYRRERLVTILFGGVAAISLAFCLVVTLRGIHIAGSPVSRLVRTDVIDQRFAFYLPFARAWEFLAGALLAMVGNSNIQASHITRRFRVIAWSILALAVLMTPAEEFPGFWALLPVLGVCLLIAFPVVPSVAGHGRVNALLSWLGDRSYGWYLWHWPLIQFVAPFTQSKAILLSAGACSVVLAHLSFKWIENPFRQHVRWRSVTATAGIAAVSLIVPLALTTLTRDLEPSLAMHVDEAQVCDYQLGLAKHEIDGACSFRAEDSLGRAALVGDSIAGMYSEGFIEAAHQLNLDATLITRGATPFLYLDALAEEQGDTPQRAVVRFLIERKFDVVVLAQANWYQLSDIDEDPRWIDYALPVVKDLTEAGIRVLVLTEPPAANVEPRSCSPLQIRMGLCPADLTRSTSSLAAKRRGVTAETLLAVGNLRVKVLDVLPLLCESANCPTRRSGKWWWRDHIHISVSASRTLAEPLRASMDELLKRNLN